MCVGVYVCGVRGKPSRQIPAIDLFQLYVSDQLHGFAHDQATSWNLHSKYKLCRIRFFFFLLNKVIDRHVCTGTLSVTYSRLNSAPHLLLVKHQEPVRQSRHLMFLRGC